MPTKVTNKPGETRQHTASTQVDYRYVRMNLFQERSLSPCQYQIDNKATLSKAAREIENDTLRSSPIERRAKQRNSFAHTL